MQASRRADTQIDTVVRSLIRRIAHGGRESEASIPSQIRSAASNQLEGAAIRLLESLPPTLRLMALRGLYPRVMNRIADAWHSPAAFATLVDSLLIDDRGHRQGFPFEVITELTELRDYYFALVHPEARPGPAGPSAALRGFR